MGLLGILASFQAEIPIEWNVAVTIFILPLNAACNPFIYTFNVLLEKQRQRQETTLLRKLFDAQSEDNVENSNSNLAKKVASKVDAVCTVQFWKERDIICSDDLETVFNKQEF